MPRSQNILHTDMGLTQPKSAVAGESPSNPACHVPKRSARQDGVVRRILASKSEENEKHFDVLVFGSIAFDHSCNYITANETSLESSSDEIAAPSLGTSNPAKIKTSIGGVGHNVALAIQRVGAGAPTVSLSSLVARD